MATKKCLGDPKARVEHAPKLTDLEPAAIGGIAFLKTETVMVLHARQQFRTADEFFARGELKGAVVASATGADIVGESRAAVRGQALVAARDFIEASAVTACRAAAACLTGGVRTGR